MALRVRYVGRASDPQAELQLQELTRAVNALGDDVEQIAGETVPGIIDTIEDIKDDLDDRVPKPEEPPSAPTDLRAMPAFRMFILQWVRSTGIVEGYVLAFSTSPNGSSDWSAWEEIVLPDVNVFTHHGLDQDLYYRYRVCAFNRIGRSLWSNLVEAGKPGKVSLSEEIIDEHNWMDVWNRAQAIGEDGTLLAQRIKGFLEKAQLDPSIQQTLEEVGVIGQDLENVVGRLDSTNKNLWFSSIKQTADALQSEVARIEGNLNSSNPNTWYSSIKQSAEAILSEVARVEENLESNNKNTWYSSIKQTADEIASVVAKLEGEDPVQFSTIQQLSDRITSMVVDLRKTATIVSGTTTASASNYIRDVTKDWASLATQYGVNWAGYEVVILSGSQTGQRRTISSANASGYLYVSPNWNAAPGTGVEYAIIGNNVIGAVYSKIQQEADRITSLVAQVNQLGENISAIAQTAEEISMTVRKQQAVESGQTSPTTYLDRLYDTSKNWASLLEVHGLESWTEHRVILVSGKGAGQARNIVGHSGSYLLLQNAWDTLPAAGDRYIVVHKQSGYSSTFQQTAEAISMRVQAVDKYGNPIVAAQLRIGQMNSQGFILLDAENIFAPGTIFVFDKNPGRAASGQVILNSSGIEVRNGKIKVINQDNVVVIDGSKNMFKIISSGSVVVSPGATDRYTNGALRLSYVPAFLFYYERPETDGANIAYFPMYWKTSDTVFANEYGVQMMADVRDGYLTMTFFAGADNKRSVTVKYYILEEAAL